MNGILALVPVILIACGPAMILAVVWDYLRQPTDEVAVRLAALAEVSRRAGIHVHDWEVETTSRIFQEWHRCRTCPERRFVK